MKKTITLLFAIALIALTSCNTAKEKNEPLKQDSLKIAIDTNVSKLDTTVIDTCKKAKLFLL